MSEQSVLQSGGAECSVCAFGLNRFPFDTQCADPGSSSSLIYLHGEVLCSWNTTCSGNGNCLNSTLCACFDSGVGGPSCASCNEGFVTEDCKTLCSRNTTCNGRGRCTGDGLCECDAGYVGETCLECASGSSADGCQVPCNSNSACNGHGRCDGDGYCACYPGFAGM
jgi:hypothetical protein